MAHFRKITVDGKEYEYNIGKSVVSIASGIRKYIPKDQIGFAYGDDYIVTPKMVANYIQGKPKLKVEECFPTCDCVGISKTLTVIPFENEIYNKKHLRVWCEWCLDISYGDI